VGVSNIDQSSGAGIYCYGTRQRALGNTPQCSSINAHFWYIVYFPIVLLGTVCVILMDNLRHREEDNIKLYVNRRVRRAWIRAILLV